VYFKFIYTKFNLVYNYNILINKIWWLLEIARKDVYYQVNQILINTYWEIWKHIIEFEQEGKSKSKYWSHLLKRLSKDLTDQYWKWFSKRNLAQMRKFYQLFQNT